MINVYFRARIEIVSAVVECPEKASERSGRTITKFGFVPVAARVDSGREVWHSGSDDRVDSLRHDTVLKHWLAEVDDVVDYDIGACCGEFPDALGEVRLATERLVIDEVGTWSDVIDKLHHRPSLI